MHAKQQTAYCKQKAAGFYASLTGAGISAHKAHTSRLSKRRVAARMVKQGEVPILWQVFHILHGPCSPD